MGCQNVYIYITIVSRLQGQLLSFVACRLFIIHISFFFFSNFVSYKPPNSSQASNSSRHAMRCYIKTYTQSWSSTYVGRFLKKPESQVTWDRPHVFFTILSFSSWILYNLQTHHIIILLLFFFSVTYTYTRVRPSSFAWKTLASEIIILFLFFFFPLHIRVYIIFMYKRGQNKKKIK